MGVLATTPPTNVPDSTQPGLKYSRRQGPITLDPTNRNVGSRNLILVDPEA